MPDVEPPGRRGAARWPTASGLAAGLVADAVLGDPRRGHPVAGFGFAAAALERRVYGDSRSAGVAYAGGLTAGTVLLGAAGLAATRSRPLPRAALTALATWAVIGGTSLFGGRGIVLGTLVGALIVGVFRNGLTLMGVSSVYQILVTGVLVILAVAADQLSRKGVR